ncbi:non-ribosomal peptide synthetase [Micromonospora sp. B006]|uniref:non-ribosomal peptide synthetase n=1 Tax=Micromonospora sp. B006 TaxID=2201999 RepID=UPI000E303D79|nr:non-ribosomal peptide synthetase [Micromonospora sp. B006]AXO35402.1 putative non-ribosomal peptide synthetase [Micromonospora sp. B006]
MLTTGPVARYRVLSWSGSEHALVIVVHHIACDGWALGILLRDLAACYNARVALEPLPVAPAGSTFTHAQEQRTRWEAGSADGVGYWRDHLADAPVLDLPTDRPRPAVLTAEGAVVTRDLDPALLDRISEYGRRHGASTFMVLLAAYGLLLTRHGRQPEVVVGVPVANRLDEREDETVGCLVNTVPLRIDLGDRPDLPTLLRRVRQTTLNGFAHQDVPFERIVRELAPARDRSRSPLFQASFTLQNFRVDLPDLLGLAVEEIDVEVEAAKFDLGLTVDLSGARPFVRLEYSTQLFRPHTAEVLLRHFLNLLRQLAEGDGEGNPPGLTDDAEARRLLALGHPDAPLPADPPTPLLERFADHARRRPEAVAIRYRGADVTYGELNAEASRLADLLRRHNAGPGDLVGVGFERSPTVVAAILAVWQVGAAYLPLDSNYPRERLRLIVDDSRVALVFVEPATRDVLADAVQGRPVRLVDVAGEGLDPADPLDTAGRDRRTDLAYVIYTSGSTGVPKGVMVRRSSVDLLFAASPGGLHVTAEDVWLCAHSFSFDFSVWEVWGALAYGGRVVLAERADLVDPARLAALVATERVTVLSQTPGALYRLLPALLDGPSPQLAGLRYVVTGGEALSWPRLADLMSRAPESTARFVNMYGITEGTVHVTARHATVPELAAVADGDVGRPLPSGRCHVLDDSGRPAGLLVPGELWIGGPLVAAGYLGNPELTAERFAPDPYEAGGIVYRTGDLCRWGADGELLYLGREDGQVQVRGHRVECAEVEHALLRDSDVRAAVVLLDGADLVGFVTVTDGVDPARLTHRLRRVLPAYMVPTRIVAVDEIPLTAHGKVDRVSLLAKFCTRPVAAARPASPEPVAGPLQRRLRALWAEVLGRQDFDVRDNFFDVGGHSFALMSLQSRMAVEGLDVTVTDLFRFGTIEACAAYLTRTRTAESPAAAPADDRALRRRDAIRQMAAGRARRAGGGDHPAAPSPAPADSREAS